MYDEQINANLISFLKTEQGSRIILDVYLYIII